MKRFDERIAVFTLGVLVAITLGNVLVRYFTNQSFAWTEEISVFLMVAMTLAGAASVGSRDAHIRIEYALEEMSPTARRRLLAFGAAVSALFYVGLAVLFARVLFDEVRFEEISNALGIPRWIYTVWLPLLCLLIAGRTFGYLRRLARPESPP